MMVISQYETMESIVNNSPLEWNGWNVVLDKRSDNGYSHFNGVFKDGAWYIRKTFNLTEQGWNIPEKFVGNHVQVV